MAYPVEMLALLYWLHMLATVAWIGGLASLSLLVLPAARQALDLPANAALLDGIQRRLEPIGWFSLALLVGTGLFQMSANPNYHGFLAINNRWAAAILLKHLVFIGMVALSAYLTWWVLPGLRREAMRQALAAQKGEPAPTKAAGLQQQELTLMRWNLVLGLVILALTAIARSS